MKYIKFHLIRHLNNSDKRGWGVYKGCGLKMIKSDRIFVTREVLFYPAHIS